MLVQVGMDLASHLLETILLPPPTQNPSLPGGGNVKTPARKGPAAVEASGQDQLRPGALDSGGADIWGTIIAPPAYNKVVVDHKGGKKFAVV